jgi:hypothetical protein
MHLDLLLLGLILGLANICSRFLPLWWLQRRRYHLKTSGFKFKWLPLAMGSIGISAICANDDAQLSGLQKTAALHLCCRIGLWFGVLLSADAALGYLRPYPMPVALFAHKVALKP